MKYTVTIISMVLLVSVNPMAWAHPPQDMKAKYNTKEEAIELEIKHTSRDLDDHFIRQVIITKNQEEEPLKVNYPRQPSPSNFTHSIPIEVKDGDILTIKAKCSEGGTKQVTLEIGSVSDSEDGADKDKENEDNEKMEEKKSSEYNQKKGS